MYVCMYVCVYIYPQNNAFTISSVGLARLGLLLILICCLGSSFIVENPASSIVVEHPRLVWVFKALRKVGITVLCQNQYSL